MWQRFASAILASLRRDTTVPSSDSSDHLSHTPPHLSFKISGARPTRFGSPPPLLAASGVRPWGLAVLADAAAGAVRADQSSTSNFDSASGCLRTILAWHESKSSTGSGDLDWSRPVSLKAVWRALVFSPYKLLGIVLEQSSPSHPPNPSVNCLPPAAESSQVPILTPAGPVEPLEPFGTPSDLAVSVITCESQESQDFWSSTDDGLGANVSSQATTPADSGNTPVIVPSAPSKPAAQAKPSVTVLDDGRAKYTYCGLLGTGSYGNVWLARTSPHDPSLQLPEYVAVKAFLKSTMVFDAFVHHNVRCELTAMHAITCSADQSPFLTSLISAFQDADFCYAVMHLQGVDLSFHLAQIERRMATREIILYGAELILAIEACHKLGFVHRDIKPANIIVGPGGHITLADYSIACFPKEGVENAVIKDDEQVMASGLTCAPEQLPVGNPYNYKVDIWTFGLVLLELFIGECGPYFRATKGDVFPGEYEILHRNIARDVDLYVDTRAGRDFLKKVLERDPERRLSIEEIKAHPFFHEIDGFTWEKCARGEIPVMFRPERPTGIERFVRNVVPRPETPQLTAAGRYPVALKFDDPIFDFHCAADRLAVDACIYTSWVSDELEEGEVEARGVVSDSLIARASSSAPQGSTESDMDVEIL